MRKKSVIYPVSVRQYMEDGWERKKSNEYYIILIKNDKEIKIATETGVVVSGPK